MNNSTTRFSNTVENYIKYRPGYPKEIINWMTRKLDMKYNATVADIGSGTGKLTELFLHNGNPTFAVEPNKEMREAGENMLQEFPNFNSIDGTAETTNLPSNYIDFIVAGQAFHWFDIPKTVLEFKRIAKPGTWVLLIWNKRADVKSEFMKAYNDYLHNYSTDLEKINLRRIGAEEFGATFGNKEYQSKEYEHFQVFDFEGLKGRYLSCSYALPEEHPQYIESMASLKKLFDQFEKNGTINMWYRTEIYYGKLK